MTVATDRRWFRVRVFFDTDVYAASEQEAVEQAERTAGLYAEEHAGEGWQAALWPEEAL